MSSNRREFLARAAGTVLGACASQPLSAVLAAQARSARRDVPWLREVLEPPAEASGPSRPLGPLLIDGRGRPAATLDGWRRRRTDLVKAWHDLLGSLEVERTRPPAIEVIAEDRVGDVVRQRVRYLVEPDVHTEAFVLTPSGPGGRRPGAIVLHSTVPESIRQPAGLADAPEKHLGLSLARRGFVTFCPRNFLWPETTRMAAEDETRRFRQRHPRRRMQRPKLGRWPVGVAETVTPGSASN